MMNRFKRAIALLMTAVMITSSISGTAEAASKKKAVKSVSITNVAFGTVVLKPKKTFKLKTKVTVMGKASKKVTYSSSKKKVATVSKRGKIKALKKGKTKITVKSKADKKKKAVVTVIVGTPVTKVTLDKQEAALAEGDTLALNAVLSPKKPDVKKINWSSNNLDVAEISASGVVTAKKEGTAVITAKAMDNSGKKAVCKVTVVKKSTSENPTTEKPATEKPTPEKPTPEKPTPEKPTLSHEGYELQWEDDFEGNELNREDWNVELHEKGWVNKEWQEYVDSTDNIYVEDGSLVLKPIKTGEGEDATYTSGRVNTQGKHDFKYGLFEARVKVPTGKGYLPAFWMMPKEESLYGQWPKCGEIDIMEVMGQETDKVYGTIHYGEPHAENQGTKKLTEGNFSDEWHVFSCEWEPGSIKWYMDGKLYHEVNDWFSATPGQGEVAYPAPFDQEFYMILNLAVGGSWVGYPDEATEFENQEFVIDYVQAYQKSSDYYAELESKAEKPEQPPVIIRDPDTDGNYANNGNFAANEDLTDTLDWQFMTAAGGVATATIEENTALGGHAVKIVTENAGTEEHSVQLLQHKVPLKKGSEYKLIFDAYASEPRTIKAAVGADEDRGYKKYVSEEIELTTEKQTFTCEFDMGEADYDKARIEFNMGKVSSTATVYISNVKLVETKHTDLGDGKTVRADGNYVYNGKFQEGTNANRMADWTVEGAAKEKATVSVTGLADDRRCKVVSTDCSSVSDVVIKQTELPLTPGDYVLTFDTKLLDCAGDKAEIKVNLAGQEQVFSVNKNEDEKADPEQHSHVFTIPDPVSAKDIQFELGVNGIISIDNIRLVENKLIKNGSFDAGSACYDIYVHDDATARSKVKDGALELTIKKTADEPYKVQVKQSNVKLEQGHFYKLTFDIKSTMARSIQYSIQRDGSVNKKDGKEDWTTYVQETRELAAGDEYTSIEAKFEMEEETDAESIFNIGLGGGNLTTAHTVVIDNISLVEIKESEMPEIPSVKPGVEMLKNPDFAEGKENWESVVSAPGAAATDFTGNKATFTISNVGTKDSDVQLKQEGITLERGEKYKVSFKVTSNKARTIKLGFLDPKHGWDWYGGTDIALTANKEETVEFEFTVDAEKKTRNTIAMLVSMGQIQKEEGEGENKTTVNVPTPASTITLSDFSLKKVKKQTEEPDEPVEPDESELGEEMLKNPDFADGQVGWGTYIATGEGAEAVPVFADGKVTFTISNVGTDESHVQLKQEKITLEQGKEYQVSFKAESDTVRTIKLAFCDPTDNKWTWYGGKGDIALTAGGVTNVKYSFTVTEDTCSNISLLVSMGKLNENTPNASVIKLSDFSMKEVIKEAITPVEPGVEMLKNPNFADDGKGWEVAITKTETVDDTAVDTGAEADVSFADGKATYAISNVGKKDWHVQLKQSGITLEKGCEYMATFKVTSTAARTIKLAFLDSSYDWYGGDDNIVLEEGQEKEVKCPFTVSKDTNKAITMVVSMGQIQKEEGEGENKTTVNVSTPASTITMSDFSLKKVAKQETPAVENMVKNADFSNSMASWTETIAIADWNKDGEDKYCAKAASNISNGAITYDIKNVGKEDWHVQLKQSGLSLKKDKTYKVEFTISSTVARTIKSGVMPTGEGWYGGGPIELEEKTAKKVEYTFTMKEDDAAADFFISMGQQFTDAGEPIETLPSEITISGISITEVAE